GPTLFPADPILPSARATSRYNSNLRVPFSLRLSLRPFCRTSRPRQLLPFLPTPSRKFFPAFSLLLSPDRSRELPPPWRFVQVDQGREHTKVRERSEPPRK